MPHPLTEQHLQDINAGLAAVKDAEEQVRLAQQAGIDVADAAAQTAAAKEKLLRIKNTYFPGR